jgi:hypothetical protein
MIVLSVLSASMREHMQFERVARTTGLGRFGLNMKVLSVLSALVITSFSTSVRYFWMCVRADTAKSDETPHPPLQPPVVLGGVL